ncbi:MAG: dihydroxy-acid dehydratase, partial [Lachnospiraceae bacterium]|nr:dihydroxy-acid dehydratase [Lachnospiraceae bacterium]
MAGFNHSIEDPTQAYYVGLMHACGYGEEELRKPVIGIVNSFTEANPGHKPLGELAQRVKEGVWAAGGTPTEFNVPAPCDGMAQGMGMHYILPERDLIAASAEGMVRAHDFDGLVFLCSCDKIVPGMLMAAASLEKPCIFLTAGCMLPYEEGEQVYVTPDLKESIGAWKAGRISQGDFDRFKQRICASCGTCSMYGTANTMGVFAEAIGIAPIGSCTTLFCSAEKLRQARRCGTRAVELVRENIRFSDIVTAASLANGLKHVSATGGSTNAQLHICALAKVMGLPLGLKEFDEIQRNIPVVAKFKPSSPYNMSDYHKAGGVGATLKAIRRHLEESAKLVTGGTLGEFLDGFRAEADERIIRPEEDPLYSDGCFKVLFGNIAPEGCIVKKSGVDPSMFVHSGPAVCFDSEEELREAMLEKRIKPGCVLVIRYEGPKGGPGMREMSIPAAMLVGMGL